MMGTGGSALVSKTIGEGDNKKANIFASSFFTALNNGPISAMKY